MEKSYKNILRKKSEIFGDYTHKTIAGVSYASPIDLKVPPSHTNAAFIGKITEVTN